MLKRYIKIVTGYGKDQYKIIDAEEAHKAYYLFLHPNERAIFTNGVPLRGVDIQDIVPAYNETMGWNPAHKLDEYDWNEIRSIGLETDFAQNILPMARQLAQQLTPAQMTKPLSALMAEQKKLSAPKS